MLCHPSGPRKQSEDEDHKTPTKIRAHLHDLLCFLQNAKSEVT